jgi:hypothetical protein
MSMFAHNVANRFAVYEKLGWFQRWNLRRLLSRIRKDPASLSIVLSLEQTLIQSSHITTLVYNTVQRILIWYNREVRADLPDRVPRERLPEFLSILSPIFKKQFLLEEACRPLILQILHSGEASGSSTVAGTITWQDFRLAATGAIVRNFYLNPSTPGISEQVTQALSLLGTAAIRLGNQRDFASFCEMAAMLGLSNARALLDLADDFPTCEAVYQPLVACHQRWKLPYAVLLGGLGNTIELEHMRATLNGLPKDPQLRGATLELARTFRASPPPVPLEQQLADLAIRQQWTRIPPPAHIRQALIETLEERSIAHALKALWKNLYEDGRRAEFRWGFRQFTAYVEPSETGWDWTIDDAHNRRYWDWQSTQRSEHESFIQTLTERLQSLCRSFSYAEVAVIFALLPGYCGVQTFTQLVDIPVAWRPDTVAEDGYDKYRGGYYTELVPVARPDAFQAHSFTFERPDIQPALDLLDDPERLRAALHSATDNAPTRRKQAPRRRLGPAAPRERAGNAPARRKQAPRPSATLAHSLAIIVTYLQQAFAADVARIGLYGSWQRGDATPVSDVDLAVILNREVPWFDPIDGLRPHPAEQEDRLHWQRIERLANKRRLDTRTYSIAVVTPGMLAYYTQQGPIHLQNWAHAIRNCDVLWEGDGSGENPDKEGSRCAC